MAKVAIIYHSVTGTTQQLANAIEKGLLSVDGTDVVRINIQGASIVNGRYVAPENLNLLEDVDAMVFGSPTFMGSVTAQFKAFADATGELWMDQKWSNKLAAGFTIGSNLCGDQLNTLQYLQVFANQHGMIWLGLDIPGNHDELMRNRLGAQSGLIAHSSHGDLHALDLATAEYYGERIAGYAQRLAS